MFTRTKKNFNDIIGTLVYCSPEVLANDYGESCDIWSCGVLMYCLLSGYFPFNGEDEEEITRKILSGKFEFDILDFNGISDAAKDLISKCLKYDPRKRITIQDALNHRFFNDLKEAKKFTEDDKNKLRNLKTLNKRSKFYQLVLTYLSYNFSDNKLLNELSQLYDKLDKNSDYKITKAELYKAYKEAGIPITGEELDRIITSIDFDNNGNVDYEEFIRMCIPKEQLFTEANLENAFSLFDKDKKGFITPSEIIDFIQSNKNVNDEIKKKMKNEILDIADEIIDLEEFKMLMITL
jgi:calcium-dependent protein kinase